MKNIVLIGMSGVGKTSKGKHLAQKLNWDFVDTDQLIMERENTNIDDIFTKYGEDYFRNIESDVVKEVSKLNNTVISTGGGIVLKSENVENLRKGGFIFLLLGKINYMVDNLNKSKVIRPLLKDTSNLYEEIETLYKKREDLYLKSANKIIMVDNKTLDEISYEIIDFYDKHLSCSK